MALKILTALGLAATVAVTAFGSPSEMPDVEILGAEIQSDGPELRPVRGGLELVAMPDSDISFAIYSITGQPIKTIEVKAGSRETVNLPGGCYIVRCRMWAKKVVVR